MTDSTTGIGDPYWFEWSMGQLYIVRMLQPESEIASVTLQKTGPKGLDDVVVRYTNGRTQFIQVKHTRVDDSLTFGDLVSEQPSLLRQLAECWKEESAANRGVGCEAILLTNRSLGERSSASRGPNPIQRPALTDLIALLKTTVPSAADVAQLPIPPEWNAAWTTEWLVQMDSLTAEEQLAFLRSFKIVQRPGGLNEAKQALLTQIEGVFGVTEQGARTILDRLDSKLRDWVTTERGPREEVTPERAYAALSVDMERPEGEHALAPPAPFFASRDVFTESVALAVQTRTTPIVFVSGEPGSGKTAILSSLANRRIPAIDLRFHAYRPITPENQLLPSDAGRTTDARILWGDLLIQLRALAVGRLAHLRVPVLSAHLTVDDLRKQVLRIANAIGEERCARVVIAIDGIDHAARAGSSPQSLLASLVPPEGVPPHVAFLIGGQPPEAYAQYPSWLRLQAHGVTRMDVPRLDEADIEQLVAARLPNIDPTARIAIARLIQSACEGNTLSTVFAVEEAAACGGEPTRIAGVLADRRLRSGVEAYYDAIWTSATQRVGLTPSAMKRLAACLCLTPVRISPRLLSAIDFRGSAPADWEDTLRALRPLLVEEAGGFRVFHNDVRIFLERLLETDSALYRECASQLADLLLASEDPAPRHAAAQRLLGIAGRSEAQAGLFTPAYALEGYVTGQTLDAIAEQGRVAVRALKSIRTDWALAHSVACGLATVERLYDSTQLDESLQARRISSATVRGSELRVRAIAEWAPSIIATTLSEIESLIDASLPERARGVFARWFQGVSLDVLRATTGTSEYVVHELCVRIGRISARTGVLLSSGTNGQREAHYSRGLLQSLGHLSTSRAANVIGRVRQHFQDDIDAALAKSVDDFRWRHVRLLLRRIQRNNGAALALRVSAAVAAALCGDERRYAAFAPSLLVDRTATIRDVLQGGGLRETQPIERMAALAFVFGFDAPAREASAIREEVMSEFRQRQRDERQDELMSQALYAAALLGSTIRSTARAQVPSARPETVRSVVELILENHKTSPNAVPFGYHQVAPRLLNAFCRHAVVKGFAFAEIRALFQARISRGDDLGQHLEAAWSVLHAAGLANDLAAYAASWIGPDGKAWRLPASRRASLVHRLAELSRREAPEFAERAESRLRWAAIRHFEDKDYSLMRPNEWFELLSTRNAGAWRTEGLRLLAVSRGASRDGGNGAALHIETSLATAAAAESPDAFGLLLKVASDVIGAEDHTVLEALTEFVSNASLSAEDLLAVWCFAVGQLTWTIENDRDRICRIRDALCATASRLGITSLPRTMRDLAPNEFECAASRSSTEPPPLEAPVNVSNPLRAITEALPDGSHESWSRARHVSGRLVEEVPSSTAKVIQISWDALTAKRERYAWRFDGAERMYEFLFPFVTPMQRWSALQSLEGRLDRDTPLEAIRVLAENIDTLCRLAANEDGEEALRRGLNLSLEMHEAWLTGNGRVGTVEAFDAPRAPETTSWACVIVRLLVDLLRFDGQLRLQTTLRGIHRLMSVDPSAFAELATLSRTTDEETQRRLLLAAETLAELPNSDAFRTGLEALMSESDRLDTALSAWLALRAGRRVHELPPAQWPAATERPPNIVQFAPPLMPVPGTRHGNATSAGRPAESLFRYMQLACDEPLDGLRARFSSQLATAPPRAVRRPRTRYGNDLVAPDEHETALLMKLARVAERSGELGNSPGRTAQAIVPHADPRMFMNDPLICQGGPPTDEALEASIERGEVESVLSRALRANVPDGVRVIAGAVKSYSRKHDATLLHDHGWTKPRAVWPIVGRPRRPSVLGGRSSAVFNPVEMLTDSGDEAFGWLTADVAGLMPFFDGNLDLFPTEHWRERFEWTPKNSTPLVWERDGERVAWADQYRATPRKVYGDELIYRQPRVFRWLCTEEEWNRISALDGVLLVPKSWTTVELLESR